MATLTNPVSATTPLYAPPLGGKQVSCAWNTIAMATGDLALNAVTTAVRLPKGARVVDVVISGTDMDTGAGALVFAVGDAGSPARFIQGLAATEAFTGRAGNNATSSATFAAHTAYTAGTDIIITATTAASTAAAGTISISVFYVMG